MKYFYVLIASWCAFQALGCTSAPPKEIEYQITIELPPPCTGLANDNEPHYCTKD